MNAGDDKGVKIVGFKTGSLLEAIFQIGDVIISIGKSSIAGIDTFHKAIESHLPGQRVEIKVHCAALIDGPWWGSEDEQQECEEAISHIVELETSIPLSEFRELVLLLDDDTKRYGELPNTISQEHLNRSQSFIARCRRKRSSVMFRTSASSNDLRRSAVE